MSLTGILTGGFVMLKSEKERLLYFSNVFSEVREDFCYRNGGERDEKAEKIREILTDIARYGFTSSYFGDVEAFKEGRKWCRERITAIKRDISVILSDETTVTTIGKANKVKCVSDKYKELYYLHNAIFVFNGLITLGKGLSLTNFLSDRMFEEIEEGYIKGLLNENLKEEETEEEE